MLFLLCSFLLHEDIVLESHYKHDNIHTSGRYSCDALAYQGSPARASPAGEREKIRFENTLPQVYCLPANGKLRILWRDSIDGQGRSSLLSHSPCEPYEF